MKIINTVTGKTLAFIFSGDNLTLDEALNLADLETTTMPDTGETVYLDAFGNENFYDDLELLGGGQYIVKREYREAWNTENDINNEAEWIVTDADIDRLATEWGKNKAELMEQVKEA